MTVVSIMQPYFFPYLDYFRLAKNSDVFVILDDVQFPRRGFVHRNKLTNYQNSLEWLTLSLKKSAQKELMINNLEFTESTLNKLNNSINKFPVLANNLADSELQKILLEIDLPVIEYLERSLKSIFKLLDIQTTTLKSSDFVFEKKLSGQFKIIELVKFLGGSVYLNSPGGIDLYSQETFKYHNIKLEFLPSTSNPKTSVLERILSEPLVELKKELQ
jgi:hypothetical protein